MKFRIKKYPKGWMVECQERKLFKSVWKHVTHYAGLPGDPFYYEDPESAREGAVREMREVLSFDCQRSEDLRLWV